jgi:hypothetical protein
MAANGCNARQGRPASQQHKWPVSKRIHAVVRYHKVLDGRKRAIRGLWQRGSRFCHLHHQHIFIGLKFFRVPAKFEEPWARRFFINARNASIAPAFPAARTAVWIATCKPSSAASAGNCSTFLRGCVARWGTGDLPGIFPRSRDRKFHR